MTIHYGYYIHSRGMSTYHLATTPERPLCGAGGGLAGASWNATGARYPIETAIRRVKARPVHCRRCLQLVEKLRDPVTRLGRLAVEQPHDRA